MSTNDSVDKVNYAGFPDNVQKALRAIRDPVERQRKAIDMRTMFPLPEGQASGSSSARPVSGVSGGSTGGKRLPGELAREQSKKRPRESQPRESKPHDVEEQPGEKARKAEKTLKVAKESKAPKKAEKVEKAAKSPRVASKSVKSIKSIIKAKDKKDKSLDGVEKAKKKHRWRSGTVALRQIKHMQKSTACQFAFGPFTRLVREIANECASIKMVNDGIRFTEDAMRALQEAAEEHIVNRFRKGYEISLARGQVQLMAEDLKTLDKIEKIGV